MSCTIDFSQLPLLTGCPGPNEYFIVGNAVRGLNANGDTGISTIGFGVRKWNDLVKCLFGPGIQTFTGDVLDGSNQYINPNLVQKLVVFYNGVSRYLIENYEWQKIPNGIKITIDQVFGPNDYFIIFPNPAAV